MLARAFAAGIAGAGLEAVDAGIVPTGLVSHVVRAGNHVLGAVISASHNPAPDNGIKLIGADGRKLADESERRIEETLGEEMPDRPIGDAVGQIHDARAVVEGYLDFLSTLVPEGLAGLHVAVDGSHGAAFELGPAILRRLGAEVTSIGVDPDGMNINRACGATHPGAIQETTLSSGADVGLAFDGDADRVVFADAKGRLINGDRTIAAWCGARMRAGELEPPIAVGTVMSNGGFEAYLTSIGIALERTAVGDKHVARRMGETGARIGGEQSGHLIFADRGVTGDGLVTALEFLRVMRTEGRSSVDLYESYEAWPQVLVNVTLPDRDALGRCESFTEALADAERRLEHVGRVNVRPSGTQPMLRVMVEANDAALRDEVADDLVGHLERELSATVYSRVDLTHSLGE